MNIKKITKINIKFIKGIQDKTLKFDLFPNKPSIFVAPNGYGKSSFTKAFSCLRQNKIYIENKEDSYENKEINNNNAEISIELEENDGTVKILKSTSVVNYISGYFDVFVINNLITPKTKGLTSGTGYLMSKATLAVPAIILKNTIPERVYFSYNCSVEKTAFGRNGKILMNLDQVIKNTSLILKLIENEKFKKLNNVRQKQKIESWVIHINSLNGTKEEVINQIDNSILGGIFDDFIELINIGPLNENEKCILIYQLHTLYSSNRINLPKIKKYYSYLVFKKNVDDTLSSIGTTWKFIKPKVTKGKLVLEFPDIRNISNGQRDSIIFLAKLLEIEEKLSISKPLIIIIDELFDYLDDANLIICQYYITKFIEKFKENSRQIFPIIMTHLNPYYFKSYVFQNQKVYFLDKSTTVITNKDLQKIVENRKDSSIKEKLEKYFFHYHSGSENLENEFSALGINSDLGDLLKFNAFIDRELDSYIHGSSGYDPLSVCAFLRLRIEKFYYHKLFNTIDKNTFLETHKTKEKLNFVSEKGIQVPEIFYLLGIIYNDGMHINKNEDWITPLRSKLDNLFIKNMIKEVISYIRVI